MLVNNAGLGGDTPLVEMTDEQWSAVLDVTLNGTFRCTRAALRHMIAARQRRDRQQRLGASAGARRPGQAHYAAAKAGVMALTRCAAIEAAPARRPGRTRSRRASRCTRSWPRSPPRSCSPSSTAREAFGRAAEPWEVANVIVFLASDYSVVHDRRGRVGQQPAPVTEARREAPMITSPRLTRRGIAEVVMDHPPVNALPVAGWFELADARRGRGRATGDVRVVVLRAEGRGFNAGVDIKEMQATDGFDALIGANRGCFAAFAAVYECAVPVIAAVHGFCLGGGIGLAGNADIIVASDDATFGLPEVDRGALGAATHLSRLVPQHKMRAMVYTAATATAAELHAFGSVLRGRAARPSCAPPRSSVAARDRGQGPGGDPAGQGVAQRHRPVGRQAQLPLRAGLHLRANLSGVADRLRESFAAGPASLSGRSQRPGRRKGGLTVTREEHQPVRTSDLTRRADD